jgi:hypothetical protein
MGRAERGLKANALKAASFSLTPKGYIPVKSGQCDPPPYFPHTQGYSGGWR